jgi:hypothetical protein
MGKNTPADVFEVQANHAKASGLARDIPAYDILIPGFDGGSEVLGGVKQHKPYRGINLSHYVNAGYKAFVVMDLFEDFIV